MQSSSFHLSEIGQIAVTVSDIEASTTFYRDVLGLKHLFSAPPGLAFFAAGSVRLMLNGAAKSETEKFSAAIYFKVTDIENACGVLRERGVKFDAEPRLIAKMPDHDLWMAFLRDPDRNLIGLMDEKRP
jgi:catechol 2,3-dioxygenase-like lactoylglutathione lyase family enzyme